jgi:toxin YhaV
MQRHGWTLLFHDCFLDQLKVLEGAVARARRNDPAGFEGNSNVSLFSALVDLIHETIPQEPGRDEYRQGNTLGMSYRHWRRAKTGRRFRLFFRYDSKSKVIVYAWVSDENA